VMSYSRDGAWDDRMLLQYKMQQYKMLHAC
jgi:hypothetical protein